MSYPDIEYDEVQRREMASDEWAAHRERHYTRPEPVGINVTVTCPVCQHDHVTARFKVVDGAPDFRGLADRAPDSWACRCRESVHVDMAGYTAEVRATAWDRAAEWLRQDKLHPPVGMRARLDGVFPDWRTT